MAIAAVSGQNGGATAAATSDTYAYGSDVSVGSLIVIIGHQTGSGDNDIFVAGDCTKSAGTATIDTIQLDTQIQVNAGANVYLRTGIWSCLVTGAGSLTMQVSNGSPLTTAIHGHEFTGSWDGTRLEDSATASTSTDDTDASTGNATSAGAALFVAGVTTVDETAVGITEDGAYTLIVETAETSDGNAEAGSCYQIVGTGTTDAGDWTLGNNKGWSCNLAVYLEAAAAGATPHNPFGLAFSGPFSGPIV